jgi:hypothetical protein
MNNCTLIIDGNWLLMSRMSVMMKDFNINNSEEELKFKQRKLSDLLAQSIHKVTTTLGEVIDNIILVRDYGSWRKELETPYDDIDYKGTRERDEQTSWPHIFGALDLVAEKIETYGGSVTMNYLIEGDDWCWRWSTKLNDNNINCIIWSTDADLKQLVRYCKNSWTCWYNEINGLVYPVEQLSTIDLFMQPIRTCDNYLSILKRIVPKNNPMESCNIIMDKIICGDVSDNIKPILYINTGKRNIGVSIKEWTEIKTSLNIKNLKEFFNMRDEILNKLVKVKRFSKYEFNFEQLQRIFDYNKQLVYLNKSSYPADLLTIMNESTNDYKIFDMSLIKNNYKLLSSDVIFDENNIFDGIDLEF